MRTNYFITDTEGRIVQVGSVPFAEELANFPVSAGMTLRQGFARLDRDWWNGVAAVPRPDLSPPPALTAGVAADWTLPAEATVEVFAVEKNDQGQVLSEVLAASSVWAGTEPLSLAAGWWRITVNPPFPWRAAEWIIEVSS